MNPTASMPKKASETIAAVGLPDGTIGLTLPVPESDGGTRLGPNGTVATVARSRPGRFATGRSDRGREAEIRRARGAVFRDGGFRFALSALRSHEARSDAALSLIEAIRRLSGI